MASIPATVTMALAQTRKLYISRQFTYMGDNKLSIEHSLFRVDSMKTIYKKKHFLRT